MTKAEITKTKETFKSILLYVDDVKKTRLTKLYNDDIDKNNALILEAENLLKKKLTKKDIHALLKNAVDFTENLKGLIRDTFQFPHSDDDFNLRALGLSFNNLDIALSNITESDYKYLVDGGKALAEPKQLNDIEEQCKVYTNSERQNQALMIANSLKESGTKLLDLKITYTDTQHHFAKATNQLIKWGGNNTLQINYYKILSF